MTQVQTLRSSVAGARPANGSQPAGVLYTNFADKQLGVMLPDGTPQDLIPKTAADLGAAPSDHTHDFPVDSVNGMTGDVVIPAYAPPTYTPKSVLFAGAAGAPTEDNPNLHFDDAKDMLSVAGVGVGRGGGNIATNTVVGAGALAVNTAGTNNVAVGDSSLAANTGNFNTAIGSSALAANVASGRNVAVGFSALSANISGTNNVAVGPNAMSSSTGGSANVAVGNRALENNTTGGSNVAIGFTALQVNAAGINNTAVGFNSLQVSTANNNVAVGYQALISNTTAGNNVAVGYTALGANTTGTPNTAVGYQALSSNVSGTNNVAVGDNALEANTGSFNTAVGSLALNNTIGQYNTVIGIAAGSGISSGSYNTIVGGYSGTSGPINATGSNWVVLSDGNANVMAWAQNGGGWFQQNNSANWSVVSDERKKKNITEIEAGLSVINALRPVEFDYIENDKHDEGFIAQEYINILPSQVTEQEDGYLAIQQNLVPYLVKAIQELSAQVEELQKKVM
jgi:hypothetical protein